MPQFDIDAARKSGYSDDEILSHLTQSRKFDVDAALKSGYSKSDIIQHLSGAAQRQELGANVPGAHQILSEPEQQSFGHSFLNQINPIPAIQDYFKNGPHAARVLRGEAEGLPEGNILSDVAQPGAMAGQQLSRGNVGGALGTLAGGYGVPLAAGAISGEGMPRQVIQGAARGAKYEALKPITTHVKGVQVTAPQIVGTSLLGEGAGLALRPLTSFMGPTANEVATVGGMAAGAAYPVIKGAIQGGRGALAEFQQANAAPRMPLWSGMPDYQRPFTNFEPIPGDLPSGRTVGPIESSPTAPLPSRPAPAWTGLPAAKVMPVGEQGPIPGDLPSGRVPGKPTAQQNAFPGVSPAPSPAAAPAGAPTAAPNPTIRPVGWEPSPERPTISLVKEHAAREAKAAKMADWVSARMKDGKLSWDDLNAMDTNPDAQALVAKGAGVKSPGNTSGTDITWALVKDKIWSQLPEAQRAPHQLMQAIGPEQALMSVKDLRAKFPKMSKTALDKALLDLRNNEKIFLAEHDFPQSLPPEQLNGLVKEGKKYYVAAQARPK